MSTTLDLIDKSILERASKEESRSYMGGSILGIECDRQLYWAYHTPFKVDDARVQRIFDMGNIIEDYVIKLLRDAGIKVFDKDEKGEQFGFVDGEIAGHSDGILVGLPESSDPHLFECKSANDKNFKLFQKNGVEKTKNEYWVQVHVYMQKLRLKKCLLVVMNKNTQELYTEIIEYDRMVADTYIMRGKDIAQATELPMRKYNSSTFFKCRFCNFNEKCWEDE